ncbi:MAG: adenine nucleotide alpha hydrolase [Deltaproteobacteria bacterium]|nr:adenine nucleotide alpha hydrolase [Deltaproteobacteria bacterium]
MRKKVVMAWSGGKDSALALWRLQQDPQWEVVGLMTTLNRHYNRISMHGVRRLLLEAQAESLGLKGLEVFLPHQGDTESYEKAMTKAAEFLKAEGVQAVAFGDLFLEDIRRYREEMMAPTGLEAVFPLWGRETGELAHEVIREGFRAVVVCLDPTALPLEVLGRPFNETFLAELPQGVDPCGENGEFHTFVNAGPNFRYPIATALGVREEHEGFHYVDLLPLAQGGPEV